MVAGQHQIHTRWGQAINVLVYKVRRVRPWRCRRAVEQMRYELLKSVDIGRQRPRAVDGRGRLVALCGVLLRRSDVLRVEVG